MRPPSRRSTRARQATRLPRLLSTFAWVLASTLMLGLAIRVPEKGPSTDTLFLPPPERLVLPTPDAWLTDPRQRVGFADALTLDPNVQAPAFVALPTGAGPSPTPCTDADDTCLGPVVFNFTVNTSGVQVTCKVFLDTMLVAITSLNAQNSPYQLHAQIDTDYVRGPITTTVAPSTEISTINGALHYFSNGADQYYEGLLFYWTASGP